jgi:hypothetical protein
MLMKYRPHLIKKEKLNIKPDAQTGHTPTQKQDNKELVQFLEELISFK